MDFSASAIDAARLVSVKINDIMGLDVSPESRRVMISRILSTVGVAYHSQMYSLTSEALGTAKMRSLGISSSEFRDQTDRLSLKVMRNYALSRPTREDIVTYYHSVLGNAQFEAFGNANMMGKHPTLKRTLVGDCCKWCQARAGLHINPTGDLFARHRKCDCILEVSGYKTRNGILQNFKKRRVHK